MLAVFPVPGWVADCPWPAIVAGLLCLVVGADLLVRGAVWVALVLGMSRMAVGLTLVAMGTSMPELLVSFTAARTGHSEIAMANVIGSNTANVFLIVGTAADLYSASAWSNADICAAARRRSWADSIQSSSGHTGSHNPRRHTGSHGRRRHAGSHNPRRHPGTYQWPKISRF
mgnify:CR=1 FL=1